jgi:hypothetical protein
MPGEPPERSKATWTRIPTPEERAAELARYEQLTTGDIRRAFALAIASCFFWLAMGLVLMGWALHTTDREYGGIAFLGGLIVGYSGIVVTLARFYRRGERAGWWY